MKLPRRTFSASGRGRCRAAGRSRIARAQAYPIAAGAHRCWRSPWRRARHHRAPDGSMAVGAARPAIHHREPAGRRQQHRHRGSRKIDTRRLYAPPDRTVDPQLTRRSMTNSISISSATSPQSRASSACRWSWCSIHRFRPRPFPSSLLTPRPTRAKPTWHLPATGLRATWLASCSR